ncbi:NACHT domain-containing protein [Cognatiyoonia sp. IB215446]|uniref:NACHT domain-containing protein n=1 Tax=Cognatiyoonia sp. IB215446 TaxID=3097355 RepID=UPI002A0E81FE|nr:NACHT domain-containing protein [Cognatiyoonia sp. IB215446]MDX8347360.1 NACHT domain-containing protein [Cognatiyoonia sp. IB215446]
MLNKLLEAALSVAKDAASNLLTSEIDRLNEERDQKISQAALAKEAKRELTKMLFERPFTVETRIDEDNVLAAIIRHTEFSKSWSERVKFKDMARSRALGDIYIGLDTLLVPMSRHVDNSERSNRFKLEERLLCETGNVIIFGVPGAGKTTSLRRLVHLFHIGEKNLIRQSLFPLVVRLRDIRARDNAPDLLMRRISEDLNFELAVKFPDNKAEDIARTFGGAILRAKREAFAEFLRPLRPIIFLDGLDEVGNLRARDAIVDEIRWLSKNVPEAKVIVTCRTGELEYPFPDFLEFEIAPLTWQQVTDFSRKWIDDESKSLSFIADIENSPFYDTAMKPLSLAHLCALYERTGRIPDKPKSVYKRTVRLHIEEWDAQRDIRRETAYAEFDTDQKYDFLANLAYYFSVVVRRYVMSNDDLQRAYRAIHRKFGLPPEEVETVSLELESHTGLFNKIGADQYEFAHKSLQEYLAAEHMIKQTRPPEDPTVLQGLAAEIAVATALSSESAAYLSCLVTDCFWTAKLPAEYYRAFLSRVAAEKPDFENKELAFLSVLLLQSLDFCRGTMPARKRMKADLANIYGGKLDTIQESSVLDCSALTNFFDPTEVSKSLKGLYSVNPRLSPSSTITVIESTAAKRKYGTPYTSIPLPTAYYQALAREQ